LQGSSLVVLNSLNSDPHPPPFRFVPAGGFPSPSPRQSCRLEMQNCLDYPCSPLLFFLRSILFLASSRGSLLSVSRTGQFYSLSSLDTFFLPLFIIPTFIEPPFTKFRIGSVLIFSRHSAVLPFSFFFSCFSVMTSLN